MTHTTIRSSSSSTLPPAPRTGDLLALVRTRLEALECRELPALRAQCDCLTRIWYSDEPDAIHIHVSDHSAVPCAPAGADRLASAVAAEAATTREASALRDFLAAIETYEAGGVATLAELDADGEAIGLVAHMRLIPRPAAILDRGSTEARTYAHSLRTYLSSLRRELRAALRDDDCERLAVLAPEHRALRKRLRRQMRQMRQMKERAADTTQRSPRGDHMTHRRSLRSA